MTAKRLNLLALLLPLALLTGGCAFFAGVSTDYTEPLTGMEFVRIDGGTFTMGDTTQGFNETEWPGHRVTVLPFFAGRHEVTFAQYDVFARETGRPLPADEGWGRDRLPVIHVTWDDAVAYAIWLSEKTGLRFSLPSEAQWEYMARAGTTTPYWTGDQLPKGAANCSDCGSRWDKLSTAPIGSFKANPWGLFDTAGNVAEWCLDSLHRNYADAPGDDQSRAGGDESRRILRGGSWTNQLGDLRSSYRDWDRKGAKRNAYGFRLVLLSAPPATK